MCGRHLTQDCLILARLLLCVEELHILAEYAAQAFASLIHKDKEQAMKYIMILIVTTLLCSTASAQQVATCHIMYDAGSSGTRLYIYEQQESKWVRHEGPKVGALADPVRKIEGDDWKEAAEKVVASVVKALEDIKTVSLDDKGKPKWPAFDWSTQCKIASATVFATAGMRLAEQKNRSRSKELWKMLKEELQKIGNRISVESKSDQIRSVDHRFH